MEPLDDIICSCCRQAYPAIYETQGDNCSCFIEIQFGPDPAPPPPSTELPFFLSSVAINAHKQSHLYACYGSRHDMCTFAFIDPVSMESLKRYEIMALYDWVDQNTNVCDDCIDTLLERNQIKIEYNTNGWMDDSDFDELNYLQEAEKSY